ncbi:Flap-structured DNA-binding and RNA-binding protein [Vanrija albida]|uniref:Flap-structured DNA-binding and RNA-binding protein n=1 Tax=Vanrija albida TaxID=181172 RepID=A0ABR3Q287_9TREE
MASSTLRPHRSPSPSPTAPAPPINPANPAKLTRQSLGPPTTSSSAAARGFGLGPSANIASSPGGSSSGLSQPRHVSSSVVGGLSSMSNQRDSLSPRPSIGTGRAVSGGAGRPSSEFLPTGAAREAARTPEAEQIDQWFKHLASWEATLEEMAAASTDQNFTEELGAIEQWFRVLSEAERTAALYSLLQHSTPVQIRFFLSVLQHMAQADPMTAMLSPSPAGVTAGMESKLAGMGLKSPSAGGGSGFTGSPTGNHYLDPQSAFDPNANKAKSLRTNRISAPGTLISTEARWSSQLDQVMERGPSPGLDEASVRSRSPQPDIRPKSTDFTGGSGHEPSGYSRSTTPRLSVGPGGLGLGLPSGVEASPVNPSSPLVNSGNWASMVNTPLAPMFNDGGKENLNSTALSLASLQLAAGAAAAANRVQLDDARKYRRAPSATSSTGANSRNVSGASYGGDDDGRTSPFPGNGAFGGWNAGSRSGGDFGSLGLGDPAALASLSMNLANVNLGGLNPLTPNAVQMLAMAQAQAQAAQLSQAAQAAQLGGYGYPGSSGLNAPRGGNRIPSSGRRSPLPGGKAGSPGPQAAPQQGGGGAGGGAGVAGPDDVDPKVLEDVSTWLRVLRLHKYTANFERSNWRDMTIMTDQDLQDKGVAAQGARSKFLKVFYNVRTKYDMPHPPGQEEYAPGAGGKE